MMATECITGYARLLENVLHFPSDTFLPGSVSQLQVAEWEWSLFRRVIEEAESLLHDSAYGSIVFQVEEKFTSVVESKNTVDNDTIVLSDELPSKLDWDVLEEIEGAEEYEKVESEEVSNFAAIRHISRFSLDILLCLVELHCSIVLNDIFLV